MKEGLLLGVASDPSANAEAGLPLVLYPIGILETLHPPTLLSCRREEGTEE